MLKVPAAVSACLLMMASNAQAAPVFFSAVLNGANESPANASTATGFADVLFDLDAHTMEVSVSFAGLSTPDTASHIHCCTAVPDAGTAGVATTTPTFTGFPTGVTAGFYDHVFDMTQAGSYNPAFVSSAGSVAAAEEMLYDGLLAGRAYLNIHSSKFPSGEIRGFLQVPEPLTMSLFGVGLAGVAALRRKRKAV